MKKFILASTNSGKVAEIKALLRKLPIEFISQIDLAIPHIEETGLTFVENAIFKARHATKYSKFPAIADDSGLTVNALHGAPGVFSARYAGPNASDQQKINKLLTELKKIKDSDRTAYFHCVIALIEHEYDPAPIICHGKWRGEILHKPRGDKGFGYDPIFYVPTHHCSAAELELAEKNQISHRGQALEQLIALLAVNEH